MSRAVRIGFIYQGVKVKRIPLGTDVMIEKFARP
jgi:hypothetical protein